MNTNTTNETLEEETVARTSQLNSGDKNRFNHFVEYKSWYVLFLIVAAFFLVAFTMFLLQLESVEDSKFIRVKFNKNFYE